jgi:hypothetical protein
MRPDLDAIKKRAEAACMTEPLCVVPFLDENAGYMVWTAARPEYENVEICQSVNADVAEVIAAIPALLAYIAELEEALKACAERVYEFTRDSFQ